MFLVATIAFSLMSVFIAWKVAYRMASPTADDSFSKVIGATAAFASLPTVLAAAACANQTGIEGLTPTITIFTVIGLLIASPVGEQVGLRHKMH